MAVASPDWLPFLPGMGLWALALYLPLSLPLARFEAVLAAGTLPETAQQLLLAATSLVLRGQVNGGCARWRRGGRPFP